MHVWKLEKILFVLTCMFSLIESHITRKEFILSFGLQAASLRIAEQYIQAFSNIAKEVTLIAYKLISTQCIHSTFIHFEFCFVFVPISPQGTTMLLPSSASNPANMMAQALTMYKSLIGNVPSGATPHSIEGQGNRNDSSIEVKDRSSTTATTTKGTSGHPGKAGFSLQGSTPDHFGNSGFSLQSPQKRD